MRKLTAVLIVLSWFFWALLPLYASVDAAHTIRPGQGIGPVSLGQNITDAVNAWGNPSTTRTFPKSGLTVYSWCDLTYNDDGTVWTVKRGGVLASADPTGTIVALAVLADGSYETPEGLHTSTITNGTVQSIGSFESQVKAVLGDPDRVVQVAAGGFEWIYRHRGLTVFMSRSDNGAAYVYDIQVIRAS